MAMLCDVKVASVPAASLRAVQDMEHTREFVANELWSDERAGFAALHVLLPPQWFAKPSESAQPFLRRRRAHGDVDRGFPVADAVCFWVSGRVHGGCMENAQVDRQGQQWVCSMLQLLDLPLPIGCLVVWSAFASPNACSYYGVGASH